MRARHRPNHRGVQEVPLRPRRERVERPAGRQHQLMAARERIDPGGIETHDRGFVRAVTEFLAVASRDVDFVADDDVLEESEVRIAMGDDDRANSGMAKAAAVVSVLLWSGVGIMGRGIGFW